MDVSLLKYMSRRVRLKKDITHQEYTVAGINWDRSTLLLLGDKSFWVEPKDVDLIPVGRDHRDTTNQQQRDSV